MINLEAKIPGAPNFKYKEFIKSDTAIRKGIANIPNEEQLKSIELLAKNVLQPIRDRFGSIRITSGFRSPELCIAVGSFKRDDNGNPALDANGNIIVTSNHARGEASDIEPVDSSIKMIDMVDFIYHNLDFRTLIMEYFPDGWIHVDYREGGNSKKLKLKDATHDYENVTLGYALGIYG